MNNENQMPTRTRVLGLSADFRLAFDADFDPFLFVLRGVVKGGLK